MSTYSQIKSALDDIARQIATARAEVATASETLSNARQRLDAIPTTHADVVAAIGDLNASTDPADKLAVAELQKLTAEFQALKSGIVSALGEI